MTSTSAPTLGASDWRVWDTDAHLVVSDPEHLDAARRIADTMISAVDAACSRFRADSEVRVIAERRITRARVGPVLADLLQVALRAARDTDGAVDPTMGGALERLGYRPTARQVRTKLPATIAVGHRTGWRDVRLDGSDVSLPAGTLLDLGATAKARAADLIAARVHRALGIGVLVSLGGDIATAGPAPDGRWQIRVCDGPGQPATRIAVPSGAGIATSSTLWRRWAAEGRVLHHLLDPVNHQPVDEVWRTVSVVGRNCVQANTFSTAALVWGLSAPARLGRERLSSRLVTRTGDALLVAGWPAESA